MFNLMNSGLGGLALLSNAETRSISAENPTGERGGGARADVPDEKTIAAIMEEMGIDAAQGFAKHPSSMLGKGWKVRG